ncbi:MAG TPA: peptidylprolyl isomerase, partial [Xanthobacteraceae bacterium]|nr:peptidylprolyl isomerase [Xanthobacteraceae bacterium]
MAPTASTKMAPTASTPMAASPAVSASTPAPAASPAAATAAAQSEGPVVAKVNGMEIREGDIKLAEEDIGEQITQIPPESKRDYLVTYVGDMILLTQAAEAKKIGDSNEFKQQLEFTRKKLLMAKL